MPENLKRYDLDHGEMSSSAFMDQQEHGEYVKYADVEPLLLEL
jgi:hypothetical protein